VAFDPPTYLSAGESPVSVATGDFNADHVAGDLSVLLGDGAGGFSDPTPIANNTGTVAVAVGEFNQDGDPDLAVAEESGRVLVLLGSAGGGGFTGSTAVVSGSQALGVLSSVAVGDFNRDGDPDLVVAHRSGDQVRVLLGGPGGSFGAPTDVPTGSLPASVAVADFDADGKPDLATAHPTTNTVAVLLNTTTVPNRAPTAAADADSAGEDTALTVGAPGVLANDSDPDGNASARCSPRRRATAP
jgi:predicted NUDIX family NTP pyrophosphohydrolase